MGEITCKGLVPAGASLAIREAVQSAQDYAAQSLSPATLGAYAFSWVDFAKWCAAMGVDPLPSSAAALAAYAAYMADNGYKVSSIVRAMAAIVQKHVSEGYENPRGAALNLTLKGIKRVKRGERAVKKSPAMTEHLRPMVAAMGDGPMAVRDRALLLLGFAGAFRRSELVALDREDIEDTEDGLQVHVRFSKTDSFGAGFVKGIPWGGAEATCPVRAVRAWLREAAITAGPVFQGMPHGKLSGKRLMGNDVARLVKKYALAAGLDPAIYSGHSLRAGLVTEAYRAGKTTAVIMKQTGHKSPTTLYGYIRLAELFRENAASDIGL